MLLFLHLFATCLLEFLNVNTGHVWKWMSNVHVQVRESEVHSKTHHSNTSFKKWLERIPSLKSNIYIYMFYQGTFEDDINISPGGISRYLICWERYRHRFLPPRPGQFETLFALLGVSPDSQCGLLALWLGQIGENFVGVFVKGYQVCNKGGVFPNAPKIQGTLKSKLPIDDDLVGEKPRRFFLSCGKPVGMLTTIVKTHLGTLYIMKCLHLGQYLKHVHLKQHP